MFNGNLMLQVPIGPSYPVNGGFSYALGLTYNSNVWDFRSRTEHVGGEPQTYTQAWPSALSNAGLGWSLSLGRLFPPTTLNPTNDRFVYVSEDGAQHQFYDSAHHGEALALNLSFSRDGSYLRLRKLSETSFEVAFPDGMVKHFEGSQAAEMELAWIEDAFGNRLSITRSGTLWILNDGHRSHFIRHTIIAGTLVIDQVELATQGADPGIWQFTYASTGVPRSCKDDDAQTSLAVTVPLLTTLTLPDGSTYEMSDAAGVFYNQSCLEGAAPVDDLPGTICDYRLVRLLGEG